MVLTIGSSGSFENKSFEASGLAHSLGRGAGNDDQIYFFISQVGSDTLQDVMGSRYAVVGTADDNNILLDTMETC